MKSVPISAPHTHSGNAVSNVMFHVILALMPATLFGVYAFGFPALNTIVITIVSALAGEAFSLYLADKPIKPALLDGSAVLTGLLLAMSVPPWAPWWIAAFGGAFAIIIGKHIFGGLGQNIFNPAMLARVALHLISTGNDNLGRLQTLIFSTFPWLFRKSENYFYWDSRF